MDSDLDEVLGDFALDCNPLQNIELIPTQQLFFKKEHDSDNRHAKPVSEKELRQKFMESIPKKTRDNNRWAVRVWMDWAINRNTMFETYAENPEHFPVPVELSMASEERLNFWMARFITEVRRKDSSDYPPNTLLQITAALQRYLRDDCDKPSINFLKKDDPTFDLFRKALDARMKELTNKGVGVKVNRADPVLEKDELELWEKGVLNMETAKGLSNCVFFYNCKLFAFRAQDEHRSLDASQFSLGIDSESGLRYIEFNGRSSKNVQGGLKHRKVESKHVRQFEQKGNPHCVVKIYEKYLALIPANGPFYRRPLDERGMNSSTFSSQVIGEKKLATMMKSLYLAAGIDMKDRTITNHSGKVGCCTTLFNGGFDDKMVRSRSGHRSEAVNLYKRPLNEMQIAVSNTLNAPNLEKRPVPQQTMTPNNEKENVQNTVDGSETNANDTLKIVVPDGISKIVIEKNGKQIVFSI